MDSQFSDPQVKFFYDNQSQIFATKYIESLRHSNISSNNIKPIETVDNDTIIHNIISSDSEIYNYHFMISAIFYKESTKLKNGISDANFSTPTKMIAMFNNQAYHTPAISLKYLDETLIRIATNRSDFSISICNHPLPMTAEENTKYSYTNSQQQYVIMQGIILAFAFLVGSFAVLLVKERITNGKHLQKLSGVRLTEYWISYFIIDLAIYLIVSIMMIITFLIYQIDGLYQSGQAWYLLLGFILHGLAILPCIYLFSFMFDAPATAYASLCLYVTVIGIATVLADQITAIQDLDLLDANRIMKPFFSLFVPVYNCGKIVSNLILNYKSNEICNNKLIQLACSMISPPEMIMPCCKGEYYFFSFFFILFTYCQINAMIHVSNTKKTICPFMNRVLVPIYSTP